MSWVNTQKAIQDAIVSASGLADGKVIWAYQSANQPELPYVSLSLSPSIVIGLDTLVTDYDAGRNAGVEIAMTVTGDREVGLEVSVFSATVTGDADALALAERIRTSLVLPTVRSLMAAQGVTPFDPGDVMFVPEVVSAGFRGRATMTVRCYMPAPAVVEYVGYINDVKGDVTVSGGGISHAPIPYEITG